MLPLPSLICDLTSMSLRKKMSCYFSVNLWKRGTSSSNHYVHPCPAFLLQQVPLSQSKASPSLCSALHSLFAVLGPHSLFCIISFIPSPELPPSASIMIFQPTKIPFLSTTSNSPSSDLYVCRRPFLRIVSIDCF